MRTIRQRRAFSAPAAMEKRQKLIVRTLSERGNSVRGYASVAMRNKSEALLLLRRGKNSPSTLPPDQTARLALSSAEPALPSTSWRLHLRPHGAASRFSNRVFPPAQSPDQSTSHSG